MKENAIYICGPQVTPPVIYEHGDIYGVAVKFLDFLSTWQSAFIVVVFIACLTVYLVEKMKYEACNCK
jgi:hypothetical protein